MRKIIREYTPPEFIILTLPEGAEITVNSSAIITYVPTEEGTAVLFHGASEIAIIRETVEQLNSFLKAARLPKVPCADFIPTGVGEET